MEKIDFIEMKLPAKADYVSVLRLTASGIAHRMGFSIDDIEDIKVSISEAMTNVIKHAYPSGKGDVRIGFSLYNDRLEILVSDDGKSFRLDDIKTKVGPYDPSESIKSLREGGFGLFLVKTLMDDVIVDNKDGVVVQMEKYLDQTGVVANDRFSNIQQKRK